MPGCPFRALARLVFAALLAVAMHGYGFAAATAGITAPGTNAHPNAGMALTGAAAVNFGEETLDCAAIDYAAGYAYFGIYTSRGRVVNIMANSSNLNES